MATRERLLMDPQWRFFKGDFAAPRDSMHWAKGGSFAWGPLDPAFDDSKWRRVDLPHDFVVEGNVIREPEPSVQPLGTEAHLHMMHGFLRGGVGWYRKTFFVPREDLGRRLALEFDGVFRNATVWLNKHFVGQRLSGYSGFHYDVTELIAYGDMNTLVVRADATEYEGWFYEGGGIYRHVWLEKTDPLRIAPQGVFVQCDLTLDGQAPRAAASVSTVVRNDGAAPRTCLLRSAVEDASGRVVARAESEVSAGSLEETEVIQSFDIPAPALWSPDTPVLYTLVSTLVCGGQPGDGCRTPFGIRKIQFDPDRGFLLNDQPLKLKGVCCHQDHAGVGAALPDRLQAFRIERLKEMGCNAYRTAHHPPTPELLDACDRLGLLVMDEHRILGTAPDILEQLAGLVRRDRNHPCVILWSVGNEESGLHGTAAGARIVARMKAAVRRLDPTRPVTLAMNGGWGQGASDVIDVLGCNYLSCGDVDVFHRDHPAQPVVFSESASALGTRGEYADDPARGYVAAYDRNAPAWGSTHEANWKHCARRPFVAGTFIWTGFDYRGEPTPYYDWPCISSHFGILDTCGFPKDAFYYYQAWWTDRPVLHLLPHWNWPGREGEEIEVWAYSNCEAVELFLNGRSLGRQDVPRNGHVEWKVAYEPGALSATGFRGAQTAAVARVETTGPAHALRLRPDRTHLRADGEDVAVVRVEVLDARGRLVPDAGQRIGFTVEGPGRIIGVGNGDPSCHEDDRGTVRSVFNGLAQTLVQAGREAGVIRLKAAAPGLVEAALELPAAACAPRPWIPSENTPCSPAFECSRLQPAPAGIMAAAYPGAGVVFAPAALSPGDRLCDVRSFHGGKDGLLYLRARVEFIAGGPGNLLYGADGPVKVWVNGAEVGCQPTATNPARAEEYRARVQWREGVNEIVFALLTNQGKAWGVFARAAKGN